MKIFLLALGLVVVGQNVAAREVRSFNRDWHFIKADRPGAEALSFHEVGWAKTNLPHTWNVRDATAVNYYRGVGWYRKRFHLEATGQRVFVRFEGANQEVDVYLNGNYLGHHAGGYTAFVFELTSALAGDAENLLAVKVSNARNVDIAPVGADYTFFGGIYRDVNLILTSPDQISVLDHGSSGVFVTPVVVRSDLAKFKVRAELSLARAEQSATGAELSEGFSLNHPHLWDSTVDPYLYQVRVSLLKQGRVIDQVVEPFGLRSFSVDVDHGLELNGHPLDVRGASFHQDRPGKGWAINAADVAEDLGLLREMGANAARLAHYPHSRATLDGLDRLGLVAWAEIPLVNVITPSAAFAANCENQLIEMIRQEYNHPAILFWGLFNEVKDDPTGLIRHLNEVAHAEDSTRPTTSASNAPPESPINRFTDLIAFNRYYGWYYGDLADFGAAMDLAHRLFPKTPIGLSEYGAGANVTAHEAAPTEPAHAGRFHPEEWQSLSHELHWQELAARPFIWGHFVWNLIDFAAPGRHEGAEDGINDKGLITYDRKTRKDAFYFYKSHWNPEPMVYITSRRFRQRTQATTDVKVYSNLKHVDLFLNGQALGTGSVNQGVIWIWKNVLLKPGPNTISARAEGDGHKLSDQVEWIAP